MSSTTTPGFVRFAVSLALIGALGPAAIDMYLASLPEIVRQFAESNARVQLTLSVFLMAMGAGQLLFGPLVDACGRRLPLLAGLLVFMLSSLAAAMAPSLDVLLLARLIQGLGSALTLVVIMSMVRDVTQGAEAAKIFALLMTIEGLAPVTAPALGGLIDELWGWRAIMVTLAVLALLVLVNSVISLKETLPAERREPLRLRQAFATYWRIARDPAFMRPTLAIASVFFFLFGYIGGAAFVYQSTFGLAPGTFGLVFGASGLAILAGALCAGRLVASQGLAKLAMLGALCMLGGALIVALALTTHSILAPVVAGMVLALFGLGVSETVLMTQVMSSQQRSLGSTAALLGAFQLMLSSLATPLSGALLEHGVVAWGLLLLVSAGVVVLLTWRSVQVVGVTENRLAGH